MKGAAKIIAIACTFWSCIACNRSIEVSGTAEGSPDIYPDYKGVTVPSNIAALNFSIKTDLPCALIIEGAGGYTTIHAKDGLISFDKQTWKRLMSANEGKDMSWTITERKDGRWTAYDAFKVSVSADRIDPYISYRLIPPGYQGWKTMAIYQRDLESYKQTPIYENRLTKDNCVNCHTYCQRNPETMVFHARADFGGTFVIKDGDIEKLNTKTDSTISPLVYPYWHPGGRYVAFSTNATKQSFFNHDPNRIEVFDSASDVVVYDTQTHSITWSPLTKSAELFETFPSFSPDGKWLYFCATKAVEGMPYSYDQAHYGLYRIAFNADDCSFGDQLECIYDAAAEGMSASFPRISPDGRWLAFTRHGYGNFSIWHKDADIWMIDLQSGDLCPTAEMNSDDVDSYHDWSGDSRWMIFSSRRDDGLYTRLYISHIDADGHAGKAFMLPQKDPRSYYGALMYSYNIPEFMTGKVRMGMHKISSFMRRDPGIQVICKDR